MNAVAIAPETVGLSMLESDPLCRRIDAGERRSLVHAALQDGHDRAAAIRDRWGCDPDTIARECGVPIVESGESADYGSTLVFAEYLQRPARIVLYRPALRRLDRAIAARGVGESLAPHDVRSVMLAHELYHHVDSDGSRVPLARRHPVTLFALGPLRWTSGLVSLPEIAAGAFAQALLDLPFHPRILELLLTRDVPPLEAVARTGSAVPA